MPPATKTLLFEAPADGGRLDAFLAERCPDISRSRLKRLIAEGLVTVDGEPSRPAQQVRAGQRVLVEAPEPEPYRLGGAGLPLDLKYEDDDLLVVDKPAGLVVHPGAGHRGDTLADALAALDPRLDGVGGPLRAGIVHRLDKDTSGLIVVAKNEDAHARLSAQFQERGVAKAYTALVHGNVSPAEAIVEARIGRDPAHRQRMALVSSGREAVTRYRVTARYDGYSLLEVRPTTGRTHQIRVHLSALGHPVAGDSTYGSAEKRLARHFLHAHMIGFTQPTTGERLELHSDLPQELQDFLDSLGPPRV